MRSMTMASSIIFFFSLIFFNLLGVSISMENCTTPSCDSSAPFSVSFPFRLPEYQSNVRCGYSSDFTLSCSTNETSLLHLPNTSSFAIDTIDYFLQKVTVTDPNGCFPQRFLDLDLSTSPFSFYLGPQTYTYYNCSQTVVSGLDLIFQSNTKKVNCMSDEDYSVIVQPYNYPDSTVRDNCTVLKSSVSAPSELTYSFQDQSIMSVALSWSEPSCGLCALMSGTVCAFKDDGSNTVECQENDTQGSSPGLGIPGGVLDNPEYEPKSKSKSKKKFGLALGLGIPGGVLTMIAAAVAAYMFASKRRGKHQQSNLPETQLTLPEPMTTLSIVGP